MIEVILDTLKDSIKLLPFLFITYLLMEYIEHKMKDKSKKIIKKSGKFGPIIGGALGVFPQCGFSAAAANLYAGRVITLGTLIAIFLTTSDEMIPVLISEAVGIDIIIKILITKLIVGIIIGIIIDLVLGIVKKNKKEEDVIQDICEHEHCHCEEGNIIKSSLIHTLHIFAFIVIISLILNILIYFIGEENIANLMLNKPIISQLIAGIMGLIPNCASSVILTTLYLENVVNVSTMLSGLFVNAGVGILVLFKANKNIKENIGIVTLLYACGVMAGIILELIGINSIYSI